MKDKKRTQVSRVLGFLSDGKEYHYKEIAEALNIPLITITTVLHTLKSFGAVETPWKKVEVIQNRIGYYRIVKGKK